MFQAGVGTGQPKVVFREERARLPSGSLPLAASGKRSPDGPAAAAGLAVGLAHHPAFSTAWGWQPRAGMFRARPLGWAQRGRETPASRLSGTHLRRVLGQWETNAGLAGDPVGEVPGQPSWSVWAFTLWILRVIFCSGQLGVDQVLFLGVCPEVLHFMWLIRFLNPNP